MTRETRVCFFRWRPSGITDGGGGSLIVYDGEGKPRGHFATIASQGAEVLMFDPRSARPFDAALTPGHLELHDNKGNLISAIIGGGIKVSDGQGFEATLGTTDLVTPRTGESHKTSAASLVMFDKDENVIWKAP
jgi:hypothetical protein